MPGINYWTITKGDKIITEQNSREEISAAETEPMSNFAA